MTVAGGATLGGTGNVQGTVAVNATAGTLSPGTMTPPPVSDPGILSSGPVTFASGSVFQVQVNGTTAGSDYDQLNVDGRREPERRDARTPPARSPLPAGG